MPLFGVLPMEYKAYSVVIQNIKGFFEQLAKILAMRG